jgi:hypothetical protein
MVAAKTHRGAAHNDQKPGGRCREANMQSRDGHQVAGSGLRVSQPPLRRDAVPRADGNRRNDRRRICVLEDRSQPPDDPLPQAV